LFCLFAKEELNCARNAAKKQTDDSELGRINRICYKRSDASLLSILLDIGAHFQDHVISNFTTLCWALADLVGCLAKPD